MKNLYFILSLILLILSSCVEDENINDPVSQTTFSCMIDGVIFTDNTPEVQIDDNNTMSIELFNGDNTLRLNIANFDNLDQNEVYLFSSPNRGVVTQNNQVYSNTYNGPPYDGQIIFTTKETELLSGTFSFKAQNVDPNIFSNIWVTEGVFNNIEY